MFWPFTLIHRPKPVPTLDDTRREQLRAAQFALLDAEADAERACGTVCMLQLRVERLAAGLDS